MNPTRLPSHQAAPRFVAGAALAGLLLLALRSCRHTHQRRRAQRPAQPPPEPLQVWEDEGGQSQMAAARSLEPAR